MIREATSHINSGKYNSPYKFILVDEFQDISATRAKMIQALLTQGDNTIEITQLEKSDAGIYFLNLYTEKGELVTSEKVVKF